MHDLKSGKFTFRFLSSSWPLVHFVLSVRQLVKIEQFQLVAPTPIKFESRSWKVFFNNQSLSLHSESSSVQLVLFIYRASRSGGGTQGHAFNNSLFLVALATELMNRGQSLKPQRELFVPSFGL